ncbi:MAG: PIN domain-containing protein [Cyclobacteriaceae bacterium]
MNVILDTNVIGSDFLMRSHRFRILLDFVEKTASTIVLPKIVLEELISLYKRNLDNNLEEAEKILSQLDRFLLSEEKLGSVPNINMSKTLREYENHVRAQLGSFQLKEIEYQNSYLSEVVRRSVQRIKPISPKGQEFKDSILWLSILDFLREERSSDSVFISNNIKDFANQDKTDFHPDLKTELVEKKLLLKLYTSLSDFINEHAIKTDFISKAWLLTHINWAVLNHGALEQGGVASIFSEGVFYEQFLFENDLDYDDFLDWEITSASFKKKIPMYFIHDCAENDHYRLELYLEGSGVVRFEAKDETPFSRELEFHTSVGAEVGKGEIINYSTPYFREESGLMLKWEM